MKMRVKLTRLQEEHALEQEFARKKLYQKEQANQALKKRIEAAVLKGCILKDFKALHKGIRVIFRGPKSTKGPLTDKTKKGTKNEFQQSRTYKMLGGSCNVKC